ncbi:MAG TPA: hypothetical protein GXX37_00545 [Clostridiaceae bacterium]|nr:hypothetical protein [Clostridiaceae bacterium]
MKTKILSSAEGSVEDVSEGYSEESKEKYMVKSPIKKVGYFLVRVVVGIAIVLVVNLIFRGNFLSAITLDPASKVEKLAAGSKITKGFANDEFRIYYAETTDEIISYVFIKKLGIWLQEYPFDRYNKNISGISFGRNHAYYYGNFALNDEYDLVVDDRGNKIYPNITNLGSKKAAVYQIPLNSKDKISYCFVDSENVVNKEKLFLDGKVKFYKYVNGNTTEYCSTIGELKEEKGYLWTLIEKCIESTDESHEIPDGRVYKSGVPGDTIWKIYVSYNTGDFINLEPGRKGYDWTGSVSFNIELKGQHPGTIGMYWRDYTEFSLYDKISGESAVYNVVIPEELYKYFEEI